MVGDHLQVDDVFSGARERLGQHQHGTGIAGTLQENESINGHETLSIRVELQWSSDLYILWSGTFVNIYMLHSYNNYPRPK